MGEGKKEEVGLRPSYDTKALSTSRVFQMYRQSNDDRGLRAKTRKDSRGFCCSSRVILKVETLKVENCTFLF